MFDNRCQKYRCDNLSCDTFIPKSQPVVIRGIRHFCSPRCLLDWEDSQDDLRRREEELQGIADLGDD